MTLLNHTFSLGRRYDAQGNLLPRSIRVPLGEGSPADPPIPAEGFTAESGFVVEILSGGFDQDGVIRITDTSGQNRFGTKQTAKPYLWAPMIGSTTPSSLGLKTSWTAINAMSYVANEGPSGGGVLRSSDSGGTWTARVEEPNFSWSDPGQKMYLFRKQKYNFYVHNENGSQYINWKDFRVWGDPNPSGSTAGYNYYNAPSNNVVGVEYALESQSSLYPGSGGRSAWAYNEFKPNEIMVKSNTNASGPGDGVWKYKINGVLEGEIPYEAYNGTRSFKLWDADVTPNLRRAFFVHGVKANHTMDPNDKFWVTDVYVDTTWARVMISPNTNFSNSNQLEMQIPTAWSSSQIDISMHKSSLLSFVNTYLFVYDEDNTRHKIGVFT